MNYWLVKSEPEAYSWEHFEQEGTTAWTGVRNYQARNNLNAMQNGDRVLFYQSVKSPQVMGIAQVTAQAAQDPTSSDPRWLSVTLRVVCKLPQAVSLAQIKQEALLQSVALLKQPRLSVMPLSAEQYARMIDLGGLEEE